MDNKKLGKYFTTNYGDSSNLSIGGNSAFPDTFYLPVSSDSLQKINLPTIVGCEYSFIWNYEFFDIAPQFIDDADSLQLFFKLKDNCDIIPIRISLDCWCVDDIVLHLQNERCLDPCYFLSVDFVYDPLINYKNSKSKKIDISNSSSLITNVVVTPFLSQQSFDYPVIDVVFDDSVGSISIRFPDCSSNLIKELLPNAFSGASGLLVVNKVLLEVCVTLDSGIICCDTLTASYSCELNRLLDTVIIAPPPPYDVFSMFYSLVPAFYPSQYPLQIDMYDFFGNPVLNLKNSIPDFISENLEADVSHLGTGLYYIVFQLNDMIEVITFMKE